MNRLSLLTGSAILACAISISATACAQDVRDFNIAAGSLGDALNAFASQSDQQIFFTGEIVSGLRTDGLRGRYTADAALARLLMQTGLTWTETRPGVLYIRRGPSTGPSADAVAVDDVVVTGTLLRSSGGIASPVVTLGRDELDRRGYGTVAETLAQIPQNYAGTTTPVVQAALSDAGASNTTYATGVNLRGLGAAATLVLVNGRRMAGAGSRGELSDISALPSAAVERVDVLLDGASALYGADAVAGVVNVIMRRSYEGQESRVRVSAAQGGAETLQISHLAGTRWSSGSAYLSYEYQTANGLSSLDRDYTRDGDLRPFGGTDRRTFYSAPGNILTFNAPTSSYITQFAIRPASGGTALGPADFAAGQTNLESNLDGVDLLPAIERHSVYGSVRQSLGDRLEVSGDVRYNRRTNEIATAPAGGLFTVTTANPWFVSPVGASSHIVSYLFARELGPARSFAHSESLGVSLGARYQLSDEWSVEGYVTDAFEKADYGLTNRVNSRFVAEALGNIPDDPATAFRASVDGYLNLFGDGAANSQAVLDFIGSGRVDSSETGRSRSANILVQGPIARLPGGSLDIAVGAQVRDESFETRGESFLSAATPLLFTTPKRERSVRAAFAEARVPLVGPSNARKGLRSLDLSIAGRIEDYDDFGTTTNPKVGLVWSPLEGLALRTSWGTSFRAGSLPQRFDQGGISTTFLTRADDARALTLIRTGGNPDLKPETAETFTAGFDLRRGGSLLSLNYFNTRFADRIARPVNENLAGALTDPALSPFVRFVNPAANASDLAFVESFAGFPGFSALYPTNTYGAVVDSRWVNTGEVNVSGLDLAARHSLSVGDGLVTLDASASWILGYDTRPTPTAPVREVAGLIGYPVELRTRTGATWARDGVLAGLSWSHVASYRDRLGARIGAWNTVDAQFSWSFDQSGEGGPRLQFNVQNILDEDPPFYDGPLGFGFDAGQASLVGRVVSLQLIQRW